MNRFQKRKIGDLGRVITGKTPKTSRNELFGCEYPFITIPDLDGRVIIDTCARSLTAAGAESIRSSRLPAGSVMMSCIATVGRCGITDRVSFTNQQINSVITYEDVDPFFLYYSFKLLGRELEVSGGGGSVYTNVSKSRFSEIEISVPPFPQQRAIAATLSSLDLKIDLNRRMNGTLEAMVRAIFKDCFVDFGPTRARMEGREPYLAEDIWGLFPDALDDEHKPVGWEQKPLDEVADFLNGLALQKFPASNRQDSLPVIKIAELRRGLTEKTSRASRDVPDKYIVKDGDFLFSWSGSLMAKFWTEGEGALNQHLFKVTSNRYPAWFFSQWIHHHLQEFQAIAASKATTMGHIQRRHLKEAMTICPSDFLIFMLGQTLGPFLECAIQNELEIRTLAETRDLLLPKLISGEIRLAEAKKTSVEAP